MPDATRKLPIQLVCTDFDGTLFAECDDPPVPPDLQQMIGDLQRQGATWVINTGRERDSLIETMTAARLSIAPDFLVVMERDIFVRRGEDYVGLADWNQACAETHAALYARVRRDMPRLLQGLAFCCAGSVREDPRSPFALLAADPQDAGGMQRYLEEYCKTVPGLTVVQSHLCMHFSHERYNKGTALAEIARRLAIGPDFILAAGDHFNDLPMMSRRIARWLVAPANAIDAVKQLVRVQEGYVSHQPCGSGVARGLEFFLGGHAAGLVSGLTLMAASVH